MLLVAPTAASAQPFVGLELGTLPGPLKPARPDAAADKAVESG